MIIKLDRKKNISRILIKFTQAVDFEVKTHHTQLCDHSLKGGGVMGPQSEIILKKTRFRHFHPLKLV